MTSTDQVKRKADGASIAVALPLAALVTEHYASIGASHPQADQSAALIALELVNPGHRVGSGPDRLP